MNPKWTVLIADDDPELVRILETRCKQMGLDVVTADNGINAILKARKHSPDIMIVDVAMPEADGFKVCDRLLELHMVFPVIVLTGSSDAETIRNCESLGAHYVLKQPDMWTKLEPLISRLLKCYGSNEEARASAEDATVRRGPPKVLAIDDDAGVTRAIAMRLKYHGVETFEASNGIQGFMLALKENPDVIITDYTMPEGSGDHLMVRLKQAKSTQDIPVIVLTGQTLDGGRNFALKRDVLGRRGAVAFLTKPLFLDDLLAELEQHIHLKPVKGLKTAAV